MMGGCLFPQPFITLYVIIAETIAASILFLSVRLAARDFFYQKAGSFLANMEKQFQENAVSYLLFLRLNPLFPVWITNIAPAIFGINYQTFLWTTIVGCAPGSFVFTQLGAGLVCLITTPNPLNFSTIFNPRLTIAIIGLTVLALLPILIKKLSSNQFR
jgi:uncharacterized membrane protein YdjX (TVP38/TMEM64 family)